MNIVFGLQYSFIHRILFELVWLKHFDQNVLIMEICAKCSTVWLKILAQTVPEFRAKSFQPNDWQVLEHFYQNVLEIEIRAKCAIVWLKILIRTDMCFNFALNLSSQAIDKFRYIYLMRCINVRHCYSLLFNCIRMFSEIKPSQISRE